MDPPRFISRLGLGRRACGNRLCVGKTWWGKQPIDETILGNPGGIAETTFVPGKRGGIQKPSLSQLPFPKPCKRVGGLECTYKQRDDIW